MYDIDWYCGSRLVANDPNVGKPMPESYHDWGWFIAPIYGDLGDGLLLDLPY